MVLRKKIKIKYLIKLLKLSIIYFNIKVKINLEKHSWLSLVRKLMILCMSLQLRMCTLYDVLNLIKRKYPNVPRKIIFSLKLDISVFFKRFKLGRKLFLPGGSMNSLYKDLNLCFLCLKDPLKRKP